MSENEFLVDESTFEMLEHVFEEDSFETTAYLDLRENELVVFSEYGGESGPGPSRKQVETDTTDRFIKVPRGDTDEAWRDMREFALSVDDKTLSERLLDSIRGSGAFRRFKDMVFEAGLRKEWSDFQAQRIRRRVLDWLLREELITEEGAEQYMERLEERFHRRDQRKRELENMTDGAVLECRDSGGYPGLSEGTRYDVVGERPDDNLVRIIDDRDSRSWYPKPQFDLLEEP